MQGLGSCTGQVRVPSSGRKVLNFSIFQTERSKSMALESKHCGRSQQDGHGVARQWPAHTECLAGAASVMLMFIPHTEGSDQMKF